MKRTFEGVDKVGVWASGGIDSSTTLLLAAETLGPENVTAIHLDFGYRPDETDRAEKVADHLDVDLKIEPVTLEDHFDLVGQTVFNQRSRARTSITISRTIIHGKSSLELYLHIAWN